MEKIINRLINENIENIDIYSINGSLWLIFTNEKKWVIQLTKDGTLYYDYGFFKNLFKYVSLNVLDNKIYIRTWFEECVLKKWGNINLQKEGKVEDAIQNGVKHTRRYGFTAKLKVEDAIQNGVKHTTLRSFPLLPYVEDTIQNGVKHTAAVCNDKINTVEDTIQNGVKHTSNLISLLHKTVEDTIQNGVKHTECLVEKKYNAVEDTIQNGVKHT